MIDEGRFNEDDAHSLRTISPVPSDNTDDSSLTRKESSQTFKSILKSYSYNKEEKLPSPVVSTNDRYDGDARPGKRKRLQEDEKTRQHDRSQRLGKTAKSKTNAIEGSSRDLSRRDEGGKGGRSTTNEKLSKQSQANSQAFLNNLKDSLRSGLTLVMVGVNPGITTALTGHAYAHKSNRYWPTMFQSDVTPIRHDPKDTHSLMDMYGIGHTNIVERATRTEAEIQPHEWPIGAAILDEKIRKLKPEGVAIVGKGIWKRWFEYKHGRKFKDSGRGKDHFEYGWQDEDMQLGRTVDVDGTIVWPGAQTIVVATTSGAAAQFAANGGEQRIALWKPLGEWFRPKREEWVKAKAGKMGQDRCDTQGWHGRV